MVNSILEILNKEPLLNHSSDRDKKALAKKLVAMLDSDFIKNQLAEIHRIEMEKWVEGMKINRDPGHEFVLDWIKKNAAKFRERFDKSDCRICGKVYDCRLAPRDVCESYNPELFSQSKFLVKKIISILREKNCLTPEILDQMRGLCQYYGID